MEVPNTDELLERATEDIEFYLKGLNDFINKRDTSEAIGYIAYWSLRLDQNDPQ